MSKSTKTKCENYLKNDRVIAVRPSVIRLVKGNVTDAIILTQLFYWFGLNNDKVKDKTTIIIDEEKYVAKSYNDWEKETGIPKSTVRNCVRRLKDKKLIYTDILYFSGTKKMHFQVCWENISRWIEDNTDLPFKRINTPIKTTPKCEAKFEGNYEWLQINKNNNHIKYQDDFLEFLRDKFLKPIWADRFDRSPTIHDAASWISKRERDKVAEIEAQYQNFKLLKENKLPPVDQNDPKLRIYWENKLEELFEDSEFLEYYKNYLHKQPYYNQYLQRKPYDSDAKRSLLNNVNKTEGRMKLKYFVEDFYKEKEKATKRKNKIKQKPKFVPEEVSLI